MITEVFSFIRGDYRTTITCKFSESGQLVSHTSESIDVSEYNHAMLILKQDLMRELKNGCDQTKISEIYSKINKLRDIQEFKPTL